MKYLASLLLLLGVTLTSCAQLTPDAPLTKADTLRGSINANRDWWDVLYYDVHVKPNIEKQEIGGYVSIRFKRLRKDSIMQIDLQSPMMLLSATRSGGIENLRMRNSGNTWFITVPPSGKSVESIDLVYAGKPVSAKNPPWDGGWIWKKDVEGRPWVSVAVQGLGASAWFPCKDHQSDEPDSGARLTVIVPDTLTAVANGRLVDEKRIGSDKSFTWEVKSPINNYNLVPYIGKYVRFSEKYSGEKGALDCDYWVLDYNLEKAKKQFAEVPRTLKAFEHWFGPFPWYEDGFKLVEAPHLGMEHQSAVAYGNGYQNGYRGADLSGTGIGKKWDFIIVHEVGHEWWGNNVTAKDIADMWLHEGFTAYSETLFTEYHFSKGESQQYLIGTRRGIQNNEPIIGPYGVNREGSGDMYFKGANLLHTLRQFFKSDELFRAALRETQSRFARRTVTTAEIEAFLSKKSGVDFSKIFNQYLRQKGIPTLVWRTKGKGVEYRWEDVFKGFDMRLRLQNGKWIQPGTAWKTLAGATTLLPDPAFYIRTKALNQP